MKHVCFFRDDIGLGMWRVGDVPVQKAALHSIPHALVIEYGTSHATLEASWCCIADISSSFLVIPESCTLSSDRPPRVVTWTF